MRINYPVRSRFLEPCEEAIRRHKESLLAGILMSFVLHPCRGYNGKVRVEIESGASSDFWTDWEYSDPSRFPDESGQLPRLCTRKDALEPSRYRITLGTW